MASAEAHILLAQRLVEDMRASDPSSEWAIIVDAGYYTVFHTLEALNALECRDSYTFADAADILDGILTERILDREERNAYNYLFYFRRGVIYGCHTPTREQIDEYVNIVERYVSRIQSKISGMARRDFFSGDK